MKKATLCAAFFGNVYFPRFISSPAALRKLFQLSKCLQTVLAVAVPGSTSNSVVVGVLPSSLASA